MELTPTFGTRFMCLYWILKCYLKFTTKTDIILHSHWFVIHIFRYIHFRKVKYGTIYFLQIKHFYI